MQKYKRRSTNRLVRATALISTGAFILGLILQPILGQLIDNQLNDPTKLLVATSIATAFTVAVSVNALLLRERENAEIASAVLSTVEDLELRSGLLVEFIRRGDPASSNPYEIMTQLAAEASEEVLVLDHRVIDPDRFGKSTTFSDPARMGYYDLLTRIATTRLPNGLFLRYRRIVQLNEGYTSVWDTRWNGDSTFADHCEALIQARAKQIQFPSAIKTSQVFFPNASIVIVDRRRVLLELAISGPDGKAKIQGDLVFTDPRAVLAGPLRELFEYIDSQSMLVTEVSGRE